ncbi:hypothetical protein [Streptomyces sp. Y1]|uniref:Restriction endonuclease domain-containing protein n=1 Tax=Streptomyces sp. Y1 TaxID=3238634 RepID=A0AB39TID2_9ACTN
MTFYEQHRDFIEELERIAPDGVRIEWSGDTLIVQASPSNIHQLNVAQVRRQFEQPEVRGRDHRPGAVRLQPGPVRARAVPGLRG